MHRPEIRIVQHGSVERQYQGALDTVLEEIALIRADREVEDGVQHEESRELRIEGVVAEVTLTTASITSWSLAVRPQGQAPIHYQHTSISGGVTVGGERVPKDMPGVGLLEGLHRVLFELNES